MLPLNTDLEFVVVVVFYHSDIIPMRDKMKDRKVNKKDSKNSNLLYLFIPSNKNRILTISHVKSLAMERHICYLTMMKIKYI